MIIIIGLVKERGGKARCVLMGVSGVRLREVMSNEEVFGRCASVWGKGRRRELSGEKNVKCMSVVYHLTSLVNVCCV